jgi:hypothetical protein
MSHKSSVSGMGGPMLAIRVINAKQLLLILLEIILSQVLGKNMKNWCGNTQASQGGRIRISNI